MIRKLAIAAAAAVALLGSFIVSVQPAQAATGFSVSGTRLLDANGNNFIMRGVSHPYAWYPQQNSSFANLKALGANTVRVVLELSTSSANVASVISMCRANRLICVLEIHNTTGFGENSGAATLAQAADYWVNLRSVLAGQEAYVLVNIGNEPYGNNNTGGWTADTQNAIRRLRAAGLAHTLVVDAPNWGQDWQGVMRTNAAAVFASDVNRNTVFSIHMYGVYGQAATINNYLNAFVSAGLPIIVGEFGFNHSDGDVDEDTIMATTQRLGIGYIGWSWSGNGGGVEYLDMSNGFNPSSLTSWGQRIFNGANGIRTTSREASVFSGTTPPSDPPPSDPPPSDPPPAGAGCTATYRLVQSWQGGFQGEVSVRAGSAAIRGWTVRWTLASGQTITQVWQGTLSTNGSAVAVVNASYNGTLAAGASTTFGFNAGGTASTAPSTTCTAS